MFAMKKSAPCCLLILAFVWLGCSEEPPTAPMESVVAFAPAPARRPAEAGLMLGPIDGLTTAWHPAPANIPVPVGTTIRLRRALPADGAVRWSGAAETRRTAEFSYAECPVRAPERMTVRIDVVRPGGRLETQTCHLRGVEVRAEDVRVRAVSVAADPVELSNAMSNLETMHYYFGHSIAPLRKLAPGHYLTSVDRSIDLAAVVDPPEFAPLVEWRSNGGAFLMGAGETFQFREPGRRKIDAGPPGREAGITLDSYRVILSGPRRVKDGRLLTFEARTEPAGFEDEIVWLSSTKFGSALPAIGSGASFHVVFEHTVGWDGSQWLGVRASNAVFEQDGAPGPLFCGVVNVEAMRELAGRPLPDIFPNGVLDFAPIETSHTATNQCLLAPVFGAPSSGTVTVEYCVSADSLKALADSLFDATKGKGFLEGGKRYGGKMTSHFSAAWKGIAWDPEINKLTAQLTALSWTDTIKVPKWVHPPDVPDKQINEFERYKEALLAHEQGHADTADVYYMKIEDALANKPVGQVCVTLDSLPEWDKDGNPATPGDQVMIDQVTQAITDLITNHPEYAAMGSAQMIYDAPPPSGTNHGETQGAVLNTDPDC